MVWSTGITGVVEVNHESISGVVAKDINQWYRER